jgi:hypothetical protein
VRTLTLPLALLLLALPAQAAAPLPTARRLTALVLSLDAPSEAGALKLEGYLNDALAEYQGLEHKRPEVLLGGGPSEADALSLTRAEKGYQESLAAFEKKALEDAERKLRATLKELHRAAPALPDCKLLCETTAMYGAVMLARGDVEEAKLALLDLIALGPTWELSTKRYSKAFLRLRTQVAASPQAQLRGGVTVVSEPGGARVLVDGEFQGFAPLTVGPLAFGRHLIQVQRPGYHTWGQLVEVTPEEQQLQAELTPLAAAQRFHASRGRLAREVELQRGASGIGALGTSYGLDRALVATVRRLPETGRTELSVGLFDLRTASRVALKRLTFQGDEYGQLRSEVGRLAHTLLNEASGASRRVSTSGDPLEDVSGTEDWNNDRRRKEAPRPKGGDPLDSVSGMEDW